MPPPDAVRSRPTTCPALRDLRARWAVLSAAYTGVGSGWGPRVYPGYFWFESDRRSGSTLFVLPGDRAVLSGGKWDSELLDAAYNGGAALARTVRRCARVGQRQRVEHPKPQRPVDLLLLVGGRPVASGRHRHVRRARRRASCHPDARGHRPRDGQPDGARHRGRMRGAADRGR